MQESVAFQGIHGAYSEQALRQHFGPSIQGYPCPTLTDMFNAIKSGQMRGILPIENAFAGAVSQAYELLMDSDLRIQAEVILHVHHALLAPKGVKLEEIRCARSHPQALAQSDSFLRRYNITPVPWYDTAGSAKDLAAETSDGHTGAVASELAAELYGLDILARQIEDVQFNYTRFFIIGDDDPQPGEFNKTSIVFATRNRPAALYECLGEFASRGLNLTKIESRPRRNRPWEPIFFLDFEGYWHDAPALEAMARLLQRASFVKMLGSYPAVKSEWVGI